MSTGVETILARMDSHPEEFHGEEKKWAFIYKEYYRDVMTEIERGQLFEKLKQIRRNEFDSRVVQTLLKKDGEEEYEVDPFGAPMVKSEGSSIIYSSKGRYSFEKEDGRK